MSTATYANQQLRAVALEVYFKGRLGFREAAARVQQTFEKDLPHLFVPNAKPEQAIDLQPYQLRNDDSSQTLAFAINQVAYVSRAYPGHESFAARGLELIPPALDELKITELQRVIYRYENEITVGRDERGVIPLAKVLKVPALPWWAGDSLTEISTSWTQLAPHGRLAIQIAVEGEAPMEKLLISIVSVVMPAGPASDLARFASRAHDAARTWFEAAITDDFRGYIKGESNG